MLVAVIAVIAMSHQAHGGAGRPDEATGSADERVAASRG